MLIRSVLSENSLIKFDNPRKAPSISIVLPKIVSIIGYPTNNEKTKNIGDNNKYGKYFLFTLVIDH